MQFDKKTLYIIFIVCLLVTIALLAYNLKYYIRVQNLLNQQDWSILCQMLRS